MRLSANSLRASIADWSPIQLVSTGWRRPLLACTVSATAWAMASLSVRADGQCSTSTASLPVSCISAFSASA